MGGSWLDPGPEHRTPIRHHFLLHLKLSRFLTLELKSSLSVSCMWEPALLQTESPGRACLGGTLNAAPLPHPWKISLWKVEEIQSQLRTGFKKGPVPVTSLYP